MKKTKRKVRAVGIKIFFAMAVLLLTSLLGGTSNSNVASAGGETDNTYALCITSGSVGLDINKLQYISVKYLDQNNKKRTKYIFPQLEDMKKSRQVAHDAGNGDTAYDYITKKYKYTIGTWSSGDIFEPHQTGTFFFNTEYPVKSISNVQFLTSGSGSWVVQGMQIYKVDKINGYMPFGTVSSYYYTDFSGTLLAKMKNREGDGTPASLNWKDSSVYNIGTNQQKYVLVEPSAEEKDYHKSEKDRCKLGWKIDFADVYMAGAEIMAREVSKGKAGLSTLDVLDTLNLYVEYKDIYGCTRKVNLPVMLNVLAWGATNGTNMKDPVVGIAQQGESIAFGGNFPDYASLTRVVLSCNPNVVKLASGAYPYSEVKTLKAQTIEKDGDSVSITGMTVYNLSSGKSKIALKVENSMLNVVTEGSPEYYYVAGSVKGKPIYYGKTGMELEVGESAQLKKYRAGSKVSLVPREDKADRYLIEIQTHDADLAGTINDLSVRFTYTDNYGKSRTTSKYNLREQVGDFYGYWPSNTKDFAYLHSVSPGGKIVFVISINDVDKFTKASFSVGGNDDWQMQALNIYKLSSLGKRTAKWEDVRVGGDAFSNRVYSREYKYTDKILSLAYLLLVQKKDGEKELSFESKSVSSQEEIDWTPDEKSMRYEDCCKNLGFNKERVRYNVNVQVASESGNTSEDDCGSKNQFYFKLIFKEGESAYVQANQQLASDGFHSGVEENFSISTNRDYGELISVQVIPDDISDDSDIYDKLKIDSIAVRRVSSGKAVKQWTISNVGWVEVNYREEAENTITKQQGRNASEIARTYMVDYSSYAVNLLFCVNTGKYIDPYKQFEGEVNCDLNYTNEKGELRTYTFNMVEKMYEYANQTPITRDITDSSGKTVIQKGAKTSNKSFMFRENHTDRFILSLDNISKLNGLTIKARSKADATQWDIKNISVSMINKEGILQLNDKDEYIREGGEIEYLCSVKDSGNSAAQMYLPIGQEEPYTMYFTDNEVKVDEEMSSWVSVISRKPISQNDTVNVFVYPSNPIKADAYGVKAAVSYTDISGVIQQSAAGELKRYGSGEDTMFYATDLNAEAMVAFDGLTLESVGTTTTDSSISKAYIQQIRSGVVIDTWVCDFTNSSIRTLPVTRRPLEQGIETEGGQVVTLSLGDDTPRKTLDPENTDVVASIQYTLTKGPDDIRYSSQNVFLTDQQINKLYSGEMVSVGFREPFVKKIKSIKLSVVGEAQLDLAGAIVATYSGQETSTAMEGNINGYNDSENTQDTINTNKYVSVITPMDSSLTNTTLSKENCTGWYSFTSSRKLTKGTITLEPDSDIVDSSENRGQDTMALMTVKFKTASVNSGSSADSPDAGIPNGTTTPIRVTVGYYDYNENIRQYSIENIRAVAMEGSNFGDGKEAVVKFMLPELCVDAGRLRWIEVEPYDMNLNNKASWKPESITYSAEWGNQIVTEQRVVNRRIYEEQKEKIFFANILLTAKVDIYSGKYGDSSIVESRDTTKMISDSERSIVVKAGQSIVFNPNVSGSYEGCEYKISMVDISTNGTQELDADKNGITDEGGKIIMRTTKLSGTYRVTLSSVENPEVSVSFDVTVKEEQKPTPTPVPTPEPTPAPTPAPTIEVTPEPTHKADKD